MDEKRMKFEYIVDVFVLLGFFTFIRHNTNKGRARTTHGILSCSIFFLVEHVGNSKNPSPLISPAPGSKARIFSNIQKMACLAWSECSPSPFFWNALGYRNKQKYVNYQFNSSLFWAANWSFSLNIHAHAQSNSKIFNEKVCHVWYHFKENFTLKTTISKIWKSDVPIKSYKPSKF